GASLIGSLVRSSPHSPTRSHGYPQFARPRAVPVPMPSRTDQRLGWRSLRRARWVSFSAEVSDTRRRAGLPRNAARRGGGDGAPGQVGWSGTCAYPLLSDVFLTFTFGGAIRGAATGFTFTGTVFALAEAGLALTGRTVAFGVGGAKSAVISAVVITPSL